LFDIHAIFILVDQGMVKPSVALTRALCEVVKVLWYPTSRMAVEEDKAIVLTKKAKVCERDES
jgi:hypothetical protein